MLGEGGALAAMTPGTTQVSMSTIGYALAQQPTESHVARGVADPELDLAALGKWSS